jgi:hypothetical protein
MSCNVERGFQLLWGNHSQAESGGGSPAESRKRLYSPAMLKIRDRRACLIKRKCFLE